MSDRKDAKRSESDEEKTRRLEKDIKDLRPVIFDYLANHDISYNEELIDYRYNVANHTPFLNLKFKTPEDANYLRSVAVTFGILDESKIKERAQRKPNEVLFSSFAEIENLCTFLSKAAMRPKP